MSKIYPFKFLDAYTKKDTELFFGRDEEINALYEMVFQTDILLVYGTSGTGKTSLIQCGLASKFQSHDWLALPIRRGSNINISFEKALVAAGGHRKADNGESLGWLEDVLVETKVKRSTRALTALQQSFRNIYLHYFRPIYLIFDQFEELYILGNKEEQAQFIQTVKQVLAVEQPVKMIFILREEYLGYLYEFEKAVPQLLRKKLRVEPMNLDKVRQVIIGASGYKNSNVKLKAGDEAKIAEGIFDKIKGKDKTLTIQLPYLQVFLDKLYLHITADESRQANAVITPEALAEIGDIEDVLRDFLEEQVNSISRKLSGKKVKVEPEMIWQTLSPFATLEGTKEPISKQSLYDRLPEPAPGLIDQIIEALINSRILRFSEEEELYEIAHDSLALRIAEKRSDEEIALLEIRRLIKSQSSLQAGARELFTEKQLNFIEPFLQKLKLNAQEQSLLDESYRQVKAHRNKRRRRLVFTFAAIALAFVMMAGLTYYSYLSRQEAERQQRIAHDNELRANEQRDQSAALFYSSESRFWRQNQEYAKALGWAYAGYQIKPELTATTSSLIEAFYDYRSNKAANLEQLFAFDDRPYSSAIAQDTRFALTGEHSSAHLWDLQNEKYSVFEANGVWAVAYSPGGQVVLGTERNGIFLVDPNTGESTRQLSEAHPDGLHFSSDEKYLLATLWGGNGALLFNTADWSVRELSFQDPVNRLALGGFSPDGSLAWIDRTNGSVFLWDTNTGENGQLLPEHTVNDLSFTEDSHILVGTNRGAALLNAAGDTISTLLAGRRITHVSINAKASIAFIAEDDVARGFWDLDNNQWLREFDRPITIKYGSSYKFSPDGRYFILGLYENGQLWSMDPVPSLVNQLDFKSFSVKTHFNSDGNKLFGITDNGIFSLNLGSSELVEKVSDEDTTAPHGVFTSEDGRFVLNAEETLVAVLTVEGEKKERRFDAKAYITAPPVLSKQNRYVLLGTKAADARLWEADKPSEIPNIYTWAEVTGSMTTVAISEDEKYLAAANGSEYDTAPYTVAIFSISRPTLPLSVVKTRDVVTTLDFAPDASHLIVGTRDGKVTRWPLAPEIAQWLDETPEFEWAKHIQLDD